MFLRSEEVERSGVQKFLQAMQPIPPVQIALRLFQNGALLSDIAATLSAELVETFDQQNQQIAKLHREVLHKAGLCEDYQKRIQELQQDPLLERLERAELALTEKSVEALSAHTELFLEQRKFERERKAHELEVQELRGQVAELNRLVAKQHVQLSNLIGSGTP
jgi:archaellum component FlaC